MHKSDRLFQLVNLLKGRRLAITAKQLAERFEVSERTIYRDI
ncbi:HTH domain-containing protein [Pseudoalteromonas sp. JW3]|nr:MULTISPECIES: HTH domain-containing protein [Pseudoalteromonas]